MPKQLATFGGQGDYQGGWITSFIQGRTVDCAMKDGEWLIIRFSCGHEARIGWQDAAGNQLRGEPFIESMDVKIQIPGAVLTPKAGQGNGE